MLVSKSQKKFPLKNLIAVGAAAFLIQNVDVNAQETTETSDLYYEADGKEYYRDPREFATIDEAVAYGRQAFNPEIHVEFYVNPNSNGNYIIDWEMKNELFPDEEVPNPPVTDDDTVPILYYVEAGDSLWSIANRYGVSVSQLILWNDLETNFLYIGQELVVANPNVLPIPEEPELPDPIEVNPGVHIVEAGEYLWLIANYYGVTVDDLIIWNDLATNELYVGQVLIVSDANYTEPEEPVIPEPEVPEAEWHVHTIQSGEYLWLIGQYYGVTVEDLILWNDLASPSLYVGQKLFVKVQ